METDTTLPENEKPTPSCRKTKSTYFLKLLLATAIVCLIVFTLAWRRSSHLELRANTIADDLITVPVVKVSRENLVQCCTFEAEFRPYQAIDLHAKVAGFVQSIRVDIGDRVQAGDVLAILNIPGLKEDLERAVAAELRDEKKVLEASAGYDDAHLTYTRLFTINQAKPHLVAKQDLDTSSAKDRSAEAALAAANQNVQVSQAELKKLQAIRGFCTITAPFSGVITKRYADEGALVQGGVNPSGAALPLVRLSQNDRLRLVFPVTVSSVPFIKEGDPVHIRILQTGRTFEGKVSRFTRNVDMATRTMDAEVDVPNPDLALIPGIYAEATLNLEHRDNALTVPAGALSNLKSPTALVLTTENKIEERPLTLGMATGEKFEVISGLKENERVIVGSRAKVEPGQKVEPRLIETGAL